MIKKFKLKIAKLHSIADGLLENESYSITRLRLIESLCENYYDKNQFLVFCLKYYHSLEDDIFVSNVLKEIKLYLQDDTDKNRETLKELLSVCFKENDEYKKVKSNNLRIIKSKSALLCEVSLKGILNNIDGSKFGYLVAKEIAEKYSPEYGNNLIPNSYHAVRAIANFWTEHFDNK